MADNDTSKPSGFAIHEDRVVIRPATKPDGSDRRTVIVRDHSILDRTDHGAGPSLLHDYTRHMRVEYVGIASVPVKQFNGMVADEVFEFVIPVQSLSAAFAFLDDKTKTDALVMAAGDAHRQKRQQAAIAAGARGGLLLPSGGLKP